jgi:NAD(P)-dependent dehydrogenase (short-subunit alcohol dehydrogenase family)
MKEGPSGSVIGNRLTALGRAGLPDEIGGAVAMLLTPKSGWINGQRIEVSGGMVL